MTIMAQKSSPRKRSEKMFRQHFETFPRSRVLYINIVLKVNQRKEEITNLVGFNLAKALEMFCAEPVYHTGVPSCDFYDHAIKLTDKARFF